MLEDVALQYVSQSEDDLRLISYGLVILGALSAAMTIRGKAELQRAPYFACSALLLFGGAALQFAWLGSLSAMAGGYLWALVSIDVISAVLIGYAFGVIALARSRDAFGHARYAALAFIPLANFVLLLKQSRNDLSASRIPTIPLLTGGLGVVSGLVALIASVALSVFLEWEIDRGIARAQTEPALQAAGIDFMVRTKGLDATLNAMAADSPTPIIIDEVTTLARVEAHGTQLRRTYLVDLDTVSVTETFRASVESSICAHRPFESLLKAGASFREIYAKVDGITFAEQVVTRENCDF